MNKLLNDPYNIKSYLISTIYLNYSFNENHYYISDNLINNNDIQLNINNFVYLLSINELKLLNELFNDNDFKYLFYDNIDNLILISSLITNINNLVWLNNKLDLNTDQIYLMSYYIFNNKHNNNIKIFNELLSLNNLNFDDRLSYLSILNNDIKMLDICKRYNLINNKYVIENPTIEVIEWFNNNNLLDSRDICIEMIRKKNYNIIKWLYNNKIVNEQYIITKAILFNDIFLLNYIFIETGYEYFHNEFIIYRILNKLKLPVIEWFLKKNITFNTDHIFKLSFIDNDINESEKILNLCYKYKVQLYNKNLYLTYLNNNINIIDKIDLDKKLWRYYLFNLSQNDLINCNRLNDKINNKITELEEYKKIVMKLNLPKDIILYNIIPYF